MKTFNMMLLSQSPFKFRSYHRPQRPIAPVRIEVAINLPYLGINRIIQDSNDVADVELPLHHRPLHMARRRFTGTPPASDRQLFVQRPNPETRRYGDLGGKLYGRPHSDLDSHRKNRYATFDFTGTGFPPLGDH